MPETSRESDVLSRITGWAAGQDLVRAVILESSRAREGAELDAFSDYDILLALTDTRSFVGDDSWMGGFGEPLVRFRDAFETWGHPAYTRLVLYVDGTKVDYLLWPVALLREVVATRKLPDALDWGYRVLLDKDGLTEGLTNPTRTAHIPARPSEAEYFAVVENFWWETTYVAKNLWRDDVMMAKYNLDVVLRYELLLKMLEWRLEADRGWAWKPGLAGRGLKRELAPQTWAELETTWTGAGVEENWRALFAMIALFRRVAREVGKALGYEYPEQLDRGVTAYLEGVRAMPPSSGA